MKQEKWLQSTCNRLMDYFLIKKRGAWISQLVLTGIQREVNS